MTSNGDLELTDLWQAIEACYEAGWTDGLPVVPPTEPLVDAMVAGGIWDADDVLLREPARGLEVSARKAAANAVMAGCLPEYFPVVGAALAAIGDPAFELHAVSASTGGAAVLIAVSGPIRDEIGIHCKENLFGPGFRANATIGRAVRLVLRNCLAAIPGKLDKSTQGWAGKYAMCFGEDEAT
ncbi:MAG: thioredoxin, partial [Acidimicrobiales bacterium]|nr:thioredoxin [Acidimicrobiales bacterium]